MRIKPFNPFYFRKAEAPLFGCCPRPCGLPSTASGMEGQSQREQVDTASGGHRGRASGCRGCWDLAACASTLPPSAVWNPGPACCFIVGFEHQVPGECGVTSDFLMTRSSHFSDFQLLIPCPTQWPPRTGSLRANFSPLPDLGTSKARFLGTLSRDRARGVPS